MFIAEEKETGHLVHIDDASPDKEYICPSCKRKMVIKKDEDSMTEYFEHLEPSMCERFSKDNTKWHKEWQNIFPKKNQEALITLNPDNGYYLKSSKQWGFENRIPDFLVNYPMDTPLTIIHRCDVCACGYAILFRQKPISREEFNERNWFFSTYGKKVIWIFDFSKEFQNKKLLNYGKNKYSKKWQWNSAPDTFVNYLPQSYRKNDKNVYNKWKNSSTLIFFQIEDEEKIELVTWAIEKENEESDFQRFTTSFENTYTKKEFFNAIIKRKF